MAGIVVCVEGAADRDPLGKFKCVVDVISIGFILVLDG
jgi:hypothetical protein